MQHGVADLQAQAVDFVHVVEGGTADSDASDLHRLEHGHRCERAGAANLHADIVYYRGFLARGIFVGDRPARSFRRKPQFVLDWMEFTLTTTPSIS